MIPHVNCANRLAAYARRSALFTLRLFPDRTLDIGFEIYYGFAL